MSQFIVKGPEIFSELAEAILKPSNQAPSLVNQFVQLVEQFREDLYKDLKETQTQVESKKNEAKEAVGNWEQESKALGEKSKLSDKEGVLKSAISGTDHLLIKLRGTQSRAMAMSSESSIGIKALHEFESIARRYVQGNSHDEKGGFRDANTSHGANNNSFNGITQIGDEFHFDLDQTSQMNQNTINSLLYQANKSKNGSDSISKISIGHVNQSAFSILEKNGFTIQKIAPNEYSAFKEL